jgi:uncharacterized protein
MTSAPACYPGVAPIEAYGKGGFRFAGMSHRGSILCLPSGVYAWEPSTPLDVASLGAALAEKDRQVLPPAGVRHAFAEAGVAVEFMDTGAACRTYNVLLAEGRPVGAALIAAP